MEEETLRFLLGQRGESELLEYKQTFNINDIEGKLKLVKTVSAMRTLGGWIVVGADSIGRPTGRLTPDVAKLFDETNLRQLVEQYLPSPVRLKVAVHDLPDGLFVLIYVIKRGKWAAFRKDGRYTDSKGIQQWIFHQGDVVVRVGTSSRVLGPEQLKEWREQVEADPPRLLEPLSPYEQALEALRSILVIEHGVSIERITEESSFEEQCGLKPRNVVEVVISLQDAVKIRLPEALTTSLPRTVKELAELAAQLMPVDGSSARAGRRWQGSPLRRRTASRGGLAARSSSS
jgi:hypothetical protein